VQLGADKDAHTNNKRMRGVAQEYGPVVLRRVTAPYTEYSTGYPEHVNDDSYHFPWARTNFTFTFTFMDVYSNLSQVSACTGLSHTNGLTECGGAGADSGVRRPGPQLQVLARTSNPPTLNVRLS
jgi:hypothetical protein